MDGLSNLPFPLLVTKAIYANPTNYGIIKSLEHTRGTTMITGTTWRLYFSTTISHLLFHMVIPCQNGRMLTLSASGGSIYYRGPCVYNKTEGHRNFTNQSVL